MQRVGTDRSRVGGRRLAHRVLVTGVAVAAAATLAACTSSDPASDDRTTGAAATPTGVESGSGAAASSSNPAVSQAKVAVAVTGTTAKTNPAKPVSVSVTDGKLASVTLTNPAGKAVKGELAADGSSWHTTEDLGYSKTYSLVANAQDSDGTRVVKSERLTTITPDNMTMPYFDTISGTSMDNGATYGIGMIPAVHFDESIPNKDLAEKSVQVTTTPAVAGAWYWTDDSTMMWRPQNYYTPGTKVTLAAHVYGVNLGHGLYGQSDKSTSFTIGQKRVSIANAKTHRVKVYFDDKQVRDMPTSMGQGGYIEGGKIALWTMPGNYTDITHENPAIMSSDSYGLPASSPYGYHGLVVPWATKISTDGIYLHELDSTVGVQGSANVSHGCLNLNQKNAKWFYQNSRVGDVVQVVHSGGPTIKVWQGGEWSVPWSEWVKGGAK